MEWIRRLQSHPRGPGLLRLRNRGNNEGLVVAAAHWRRKLELLVVDNARAAVSHFDVGIEPTRGVVGGGQSPCQRVGGLEVSSNEWIAVLVGARANQRERLELLVLRRCRTAPARSNAAMTDVERRVALGIGEQRLAAGVGEHTKRGRAQRGEDWIAVGKGKQVTLVHLFVLEERDWVGREQGGQFQSQARARLEHRRQTEQHMRFGHSHLIAGPVAGFSQDGCRSPSE